MATDRWFFPTNTDNLKTILSHGLICGPEGYKKYYADISSDFPGFIPVFRNGNGSHVDALIKARAEDDSLVVCLLEIDLAQIVSGNAYLRNYETIDISKNIPADQQLNTILLPTPLPLSCIKQVIFDSPVAKKTFEDDVKCYGDTPQGMLKLIAANKPDKKFFKKNSQQSVGDKPANNEGSSDSEQKIPKRNTINYSRIYSLGGLLATLFYIGKNGVTTTKVFSDCTKMEKLSDIETPLIQGLTNYFFHQENLRESSSPQMLILFNVLEILVNQESRECISAVIDFLQAEESFNRSNERIRAKELSERISSFYHNTTDAKASTLFAESSSKLEKALLLLTHREDVAGVIETDIAELDVFDEDDYIIAAMLFGTRSKYYKIPLTIRQYKGIHECISILMAQYTHNNDNSGLTFKTTPIPLTVTDMVNPKSKKANWYGFIQWFSKKYSIKNCFQTTMPNKQFVNDKGKSTYEGVILPDIDIKESEYFKSMSKIAIDENDYETIVKKYKSV